jgi:hypothetical protein
MKVLATQLSLTNITIYSLIVGEIHLNLTKHRVWCTWFSGPYMNKSMLRMKRVFEYVAFTLTMCILHFCLIQPCILYIHILGNGLYKKNIFEYVLILSHYIMITEFYLCDCLQLAWDMWCNATHKMFFLMLR